MTTLQFIAIFGPVAAFILGRAVGMLAERRAPKRCWNCGVLLNRGTR